MDNREISRVWSRMCVVLVTTIISKRNW